MSFRWEHFPHEADVGVRGRGDSKEAAFEAAALALTAVVTDPEGIEPREEVALSCRAPDDELLLAAWLNAVVYEMATRRMLFGRFKVGFRGGAIEGRAWGEPVDRERHRPAVEVKGATLTEILVERRPEGGWVAQCVVDV